MTSNDIKLIGGTDEHNKHITTKTKIKVANTSHVLCAPLLAVSGSLALLLPSNLNLRKVLRNNLGSLTDSTHNRHPTHPQTTGTLLPSRNSLAEALLQSPLASRFEPEVNSQTQHLFPLPSSPPSIPFLPDADLTLTLTLTHLSCVSECEGYPAAWRHTGAA